MSNPSCPPNKPLLQSDFAWPSEVPDRSQATTAAVDQYKSDLKIQNPSEYTVSFFPRPPEYLESHFELFSKFKNIRIAEEFSIHDHKAYEDKHLSIASLESSQYSIEADQVSSIRELENEDDTKKVYGVGYVFSILITVFTIEFTGALEIVYMTPYFLKLKLNEWIDATFWTFPLVFTTLLKTPISILAGHVKYQRPTLFVLMCLSIFGCMMFAYSDEITLSKTITAEQRRVLMTWLGLLAFCFIDVANEMVAVVQNRIIEENNEMSHSLNKQASISGSIGKIMGYFCGSLQALRMSYSEVLERNMDSSFLTAGGLMLISICLSYSFQSRLKNGYHGPLLPKFKSLTLSHFLPSLARVKTSSRKMKFVLLSHFFGAGSIVMLSVYATCWVAQDVLQGNPIAKFRTTDSQLFEVGVSWGSLGLMFTSVVILFMSYGLHRMLAKPHKNRFKMLHLFSQFLSSTALFAIVVLGDLNSVFVVIPLTGLAFQTFHTVPEILAEILESEEGKPGGVGTYRTLLEASFFYAQVLMWLIVPLVFIFFPDRDDNKWGMLTAASSGFASVIFALFI